MKEKPRFTISDLLDPEKMKEFDKENERLSHFYTREGQITERRGRKKREIELPEENFEGLNKLETEDETLIEINENEKD